MLKSNFVLQMEKYDDAETITLINGSLSSLMAHHKVTLDRGYKEIVKLILMFSFLAECIMADKIAQVEEFCTHSKILGGYQIKKYLKV